MGVQSCRTSRVAASKIQAASTLELSVEGWEDP